MEGWPSLALLLVGVVILLIFLLSYVCASFILAPLFHTNRLLDILLKDTLHELNVPLATIKANTQMLLHTLEDAKDKKRLARIEKAGENLHTLYETLDYYIKREIRLVKEEVFDAKKVISECLEELSDLRDDVFVEAQLTSTLVNTDLIGFKKMVQNLLTNAYKYNKTGGKIMIHLNDERLKISDTGQGMNETTRFHLFDRYYQENSQVSGYGIGLSIVKAYCDEYGIFISLRSQEGQGTDVELRLNKITVKSQR